MTKFKPAGSYFPLLLILVISVLALAAAFTAEFEYHITPCLLCLAQRVPFALAIIFSAIGLVWPRAVRGILSVLAVLFFINAGIAVYQVGIEHQLWGLTESGDSQICTASNLSVQNIKDLYQSMSGTPVGDCAHPAFNYRGITFAVMNLLLSSALFFAALGFRIRRR